MKVFFKADGNEEGTKKKATECQNADVQATEKFISINETDR